MGYGWGGVGCGDKSGGVGSRNNLVLVRRYEINRKRVQIRDRAMRCLIGNLKQTWGFKIGLSYISYIVKE